MATKEKSVPGYYIFDRHLEPTEEKKHDITVGFYYPKEGGCVCEAALEYEESSYNQTSPLGPRLSRGWTLKLYDDCLPSAKRFLKLQLELAKFHVKAHNDPKYNYSSGKDATMSFEDVLTALKKAGFKHFLSDEQKRERYRALEVKALGEGVTAKEQTEAKRLAKELGIKREKKP